VPLGQVGSSCSLNMQGPYSIACPCAPGLTCTPSTAGMGICTGFGSVGNCPQDAFVCPEGSYVYRVPPACQFPACYGQTVCQTDVQACPSGGSVGRVPPTCNFAPCGGNAVCATDVQVCPNTGLTVARVAPYCDFAPCGASVVCPTDVQTCPNSGFVVHRVPPACVFASCSAQTPGTCPPGQAMCDIYMQQRGIQCVINTCVSITPCFNHTMCGVGYYCYSCLSCRFSQGCLLTAACSGASALGGDCAPVTNCLRLQNAVDGVCPWGNHTCSAVICPTGHYCVPGPSNYWSGVPTYTCQSPAVMWAPATFTSFLTLIVALF